MRLNMGLFAIMTLPAMLFKRGQSTTPSTSFDITHKPSKVQKNAYYTLGRDGELIPLDHDAVEAFMDANPPEPLKLH